MTKYYLNNPCEVLTTFEDKTVIRIAKDICVDSGYHLEPPSYEEVYVESIVPTSQLTDGPINFSEEYKKLSEIKKENEEHIRKMREEISREKHEARNEIEELKKASEKFDGLKEMFHYLNGDYNYVILFHSYRSPEIKNIDECFCNNSNKELASVSFRVEDYHRKEILGKFKMYIGQYSDDSGYKYEAKGFKTLEEAKQYYIENCLDDITEGIVKECDKHGIHDSRVEEFKNNLIKKREEEKRIKKAKLEKELELLSK